MRRGFAAAALALVALATSPAHAGSPTAGEWLQRMTESLASLNYDGLFTHTAGRQSETMRIVHRVEGGRSLERLVSLDGSGREIVRTPEEIHFYMPDRRVVLVEPRSDEGSLLKALPVTGPRLDELYSLEVSKGNRLLGRDVRVLDVRPRDAYRYGYRLWLDEKTAMPLRSEVLNVEGKAVEAIHFTKLETFERIDPRELEPAVDATGYQWVRASTACRAAGRGQRLAPKQDTAGLPARGDADADRAGRAGAGAAPDLFRRLRLGVGVHRARNGKGPGAAGVHERGVGQCVFHAGPRLRRHRRGRSAGRHGPGHRHLAGPGRRGGRACHAGAGSQESLTP
jgi:outer membrane lipoprotein-sorting protein